MDLHPGNVFFDKKMTEAELVDWGNALDYDEKVGAQAAVCSLNVTNPLPEGKQ